MEFISEVFFGKYSKMKKFQFFLKRAYFNTFLCIAPSMNILSTNLWVQYVYIYIHTHIGGLMGYINNIYPKKLQFQLMDSLSLFFNGSAFIPLKFSKFIGKNGKIMHISENKLEKNPLRSLFWLCNLVISLSNSTPTDVTAGGLIHIWNKTRTHNQSFTSFFLLPRQQQLHLQQLLDR